MGFAGFQFFVRPSCPLCLKGFYQEAIYLGLRTSDYADYTRQKGEW